MYIVFSTVKLVKIDTLPLRNNCECYDSSTVVIDKSQESKYRVKSANSDERKTFSERISK